LTTMGRSSVSFVMTTTLGAVIDDVQCTIVK
jgi:hypothetical protein